jgi:hypothetical protein
LLIDDILPRFDFREFHSTRVDASAERIYEVIRHGELTAHPVIRALLALRGLESTRRTFSLDVFLERGFTLLAEAPPREIVLALEGPFWKPACKLNRVDSESFRNPVPSGVARAVWNFAVAPDGVVSTETRILCGDDARRRFGAYWLLIRPFSGVIRRLMLRAIRVEAERA